MKAYRTGDWYWIPELQTAFRPLTRPGKDVSDAYTALSRFGGELREYEVLTAALPEPVQNALRRGD